MVDIPVRPEGNPSAYTPEVIMGELVRCSDKTPGTQYGFPYWLKNYCRVYNNNAKSWVYMDAWQSPQALALGYDDQLSAARAIAENNRVIGLKARQVGATTLLLAYYLWEALLHPVCFILLLSRGDEEAKELLRRVKSMFSKLPYWMKPKEITASSKKEWRLSNESSLLSLTTRRGDSYSATHVLIDEAELLYRANTSLEQVLLNLEPTIGMSGKIALISKIDKSRPRSTFKTMYRAAIDGDSPYKSIFIPYYVVPDRDKEWYDTQIQTSRSMDGTDDFVLESYPATPEDALAPKATNKRLLKKWLDRCYIQETGYVRGDQMLDAYPLLQTIGSLRIFRTPGIGGEYIVTADPSEGLIESDNASITVMELSKGEEVATFAATVEPSILGGIIEKLSEAYNNAPVLYEMNQHGRALGLWLRDNTEVPLLRGYSAHAVKRKVGWDQNAKTKPLMYDICAEDLMQGNAIIHSLDTYIELSMIDAIRLQAPKGMHDDRATTFALALAGRRLCIDYKFDWHRLTMPSAI